MATLALILMIAALVLFLVDAFANTGWRFNIQSLGLACFVGAIILGGASALAT